MRHQTGDMRRRFFLRNLAAFLLPALLAIFILGGALFVMSSQYASVQARSIGEGLLQQSRASLEFLLGEIDTMDIIFKNHPPFNFRLKRFLMHAQSGVSYEDYETVANATSLLSAIASANQHLFSIYIYYDGGGEYFLDSASKVANLSYFYDTDWFDSYQAQSESVRMWLEVRNIRVYENDANATPVLSIFRRISPYGKANAGLIVYNLKIGSVNQLLRSMEPNADTHLLVADESGEIIFSSDEEIASAAVGRVPQLRSSNDETFITLASGRYRVCSLSSEYFGLCYYVLQHERMLSELPMATLKTLVLVVSLCAVVSVFAATIAARNSSRRLYGIIELMDCASQHKPLPQVQAVPADPYGYVLNNILHAFLEQDQMRSQLAERRYEIQVLSLQALHNQINPHFLYNTLQAVYWHVVGKDGAPSATSEMIVSLTEILKYALGADSVSVALEDEIQIAQSYLEIQSVRFPGQFNVFWNIAPQTRTLQVIRLLLQPLLENCFQHGLAKRTQQIDIRICSSVEQGRLLLSVTDNGAGMTPQRLGEIQQALETPSKWENRHIGLLNTHKRLRLLFGECYGLSVASKPYQETVIQLTLPALTDVFDMQKIWDEGENHGLGCA